MGRDPAHEVSVRLGRTGSSETNSELAAGAITPAWDANFSCRLAAWAWRDQHESG